MGDVMLSLGTVRFSVSEAAYQTLARATRYRLPAHERVGNQVAYQYTGPGEDTITLSGIIMPTYRGRPGVLDDLREVGAAGEPRVLTSGTGRVLGRWIIDEVTEKRSAMFSRGEPRKIEFKVKLRRDDDAAAGRTDQLASAAAATGDTRAVVAAVEAAVGAGADPPGVIAAARAAA